MEMDSFDIIHTVNLSWGAVQREHGFRKSNFFAINISGFFFIVGRLFK